MTSLLFDITPSEEDTLETALTALSGLGLLMLVMVALAMYILTAIALQRLFAKAGYPRPWAAWIPVWNQWVLFELGAQNGAWSLLVFATLLGGVPGLGNVLVLAANVVLILVTVYAAMNVNKAVGRESLGWTVLAVFLPAIWIWILGFSRNRFSGARRTGPYFWGSPFTTQPGDAAFPGRPEETGPAPASAPSASSQEARFTEALPKPQAAPLHPRYGAQSPDGDSPAPATPAPKPQANGEDTATPEDSASTETPDEHPAR